MANQARNRPSWKKSTSSRRIKRIVKRGPRNTKKSGKVAATPVVDT